MEGGGGTERVVKGTAGSGPRHPYLVLGHGPVGRAEPGEVRKVSLASAL